ncbi:cardiolipin synthase B [Sulfuriferula sp. AH1]|uniref:cardiolipin synthase ClsB n=1 Tax=Sulfuriferula sp. AH1 TaxID=1985873 RepID=UPI000B3B2383|nr:cardiolipin synthase ClsB [Sulfuriferula sp. AH1]ARU31022.1 cardiolipin synthase B [Sulfuriferula sp. AH1]
MRGYLLPGNRVDLLECGLAYFPALRDAIDAAQHEVDLQTYIFAGDATGRMIAEALSRAARRGVRVRVLVDGFGSYGLSPELVRGMRDAGVDWLVFRPEPGWLALRRYRLRRLHRKVVVIDAKVAFIGGINIIDDMDTPGQIPPRFDYAARVQGPILSRIVPDVRRLWSLVRWSQNKVAWHHRPHMAIFTEAAGRDEVAFLVRDNFRHRRDIEQAYMAAIAGARESILIANAYFLPGMRFRRALVEAAGRGVKVTLLLQGRIEYRLMHYASRALYGQLLEAGVHICEYRKSFLHAKVAVIDEFWATVGSSNIDPLSLLLAREANLVIEGGDFALTLQQGLQAAMTDGGTMVLSDDWQRRSWYQRILPSMALGLVRALMGLVGYGRVW